MTETNTYTLPLTGGFFLERASPAVRKLLVSNRIRAMRGEFENALRSLQDYFLILPMNLNRDKVAIGMLRSELLHLNLQNEEATRAFDEFVTPHTSALTQEEKFAVEQNRNDLDFARWAPNNVGDFHNLVDQKQLLNYEWLNYRDLFEAKQNAEQGKHNRTLPVLWQQVRRAYYHGCWRAQQWTGQLFAAECISLKLWGEAVHHTITSKDDSLIPTVTEGLLSSCNVELIQRAVARIVAIANLRTHFVVACKNARGDRRCDPGYRDCSPRSVASSICDRGSKLSIWTESGDSCLGCDQSNRLPNASRACPAVYHVGDLALGLDHQA